jgi:hypothetical protein
VIRHSIQLIGFVFLKKALNNPSKPNISVPDLSELVPRKINKKEGENESICLDSLVLFVDCVWWRSGY